MTSLSTPSEIIAYIGAEGAADVLGVPVATVTRYRWRGKLPASWLDALEDAAGRPLPRNAFSFKRSGQ